MELRSSAFGDVETIPKKYTCEGENISPPLTINDVPEGTLCLALIVRDPDAPGGDFVHWIVWNIDPGTRMIQEGEGFPGAVEGANDASGMGWVGPCPPRGEHRYQFHLYALNSKLDLPAGSNKDEFRAQEECMVGSASLTGLYQKGVQ